MTQRDLQRDSAHQAGAKLNVMLSRGCPWSSPQLDGTSGGVAVFPVHKPPAMMRKTPTISPNLTKTCTRRSCWLSLVFVRFDIARILLGAERTASPMRGSRADHAAISSGEIGGV